jgi:hypothetical protein
MVVVAAIIALLSCIHSTNIAHLPRLSQMAGRSRNAMSASCHLTAAAWGAFFTIPGGARRLASFRKNFRRFRPKD